MLSNPLLYFTTQVINPNGVKVTNYDLTSQDEIGSTELYDQILNKIGIVLFIIKIESTAIN